MLESHFINRILGLVKLGTLSFLLLAIIFFTLNAFFPLPVEKLHPPSSTIVLDRNGQVLRVYLAPDDMWRIPVGYDEISPLLKQAVLTFEDRYFYWHFGINPISILRAAWANLRAGHIVQGGSTITMQVARLMEPKPRTLKNKLIEAFRALQLEWKFSKEQILEFYFNLAPYGGNLVGIGAAAQFYFNKRSDQLSLGEAALLTVIPNAPNRYRPDLNVKMAHRARRKVLERLFRQKKITERDQEEALSEPIPAERFPAPFRAPHFADELKQRYPQLTKIHTTIDLNIQTLVENLLHQHLKPWRARGITNGAVVVIENKTRAVRALVGSLDFFDETSQGQVNGAMSPRSPGSALKPFVYALGLEQGLVSPQSLLYDVPVEYSGYRPVNYDNKYHGAVSMEEALIRSLNVPAVNLASQLAGGGVYTFLKEAGLSTLKQPPEYYGLTLVLGGCEVTLLELTNLYAGLAEGGRFRSYRWLEDQSNEAGKSLLSSGTCYIITEILSKLRRPELPSSWELTVDVPKIAWKTGTSYGHRDAWSIGYTPEYTIGVWVGNFDGRGVPALVGAEAAAPLLFEIFEALLKPATTRWFIQPESVGVRQVCAVSGMPLSKYCPAAKSELYLPGISPAQRCTLHRMILVDEATGFRLCPVCRSGRKYRQRIVTVWPAKLASWMIEHGIPVDQIPRHYPRCPKIAAGQTPVILSPLANSEYRIRPDVPLDYQKLPLKAAVSNQIKKLYWFLNGRLIFTGNPHQIFFLTPAQGKYKLICMDEEGRSSEVQFVIR